nr:serine/arginine repetitive matrix protein 1 isoform X1 [Tanacetum cinerariifolium]
MSGGFFRGTTGDQDTRFSNKHAKLLKSQKFHPELKNLVDMTKVNMDVMRPWIAELLGSKDEVLINFIYGLQEENLVNGKEIQISLTGFMEKNTGKFMKELWTHLFSAQENASGVPQQFLDAKEEESRKKQEDRGRITTELKRAKEKEGEGHVLPFNEGHVLPFDGGHIPPLDDDHDPPSAEGLNLLLVEGRGPLSDGQCVLPSGGDCVPPTDEGLPSGAGSPSLEVRFLIDQLKIWGIQYHGGTNSGRTTGSPFIATSYDYDAPLDEFDDKTCIATTLGAMKMTVVRILESSKVYVT